MAGTNNETQLADKHQAESLLESVSALQNRLSEPWAANSFSIEDDLRRELARKLSELSAQLSLPIPKRFRSVMKVNRLELSLRSGCKLSSILELRVRNNRKETTAAMSMDVDTRDPNAVENALQFIQSTSYRVLSLKLPQEGCILSDATTTFFIEALSSSEIEEVELFTGSSPHLMWIEFLRRVQRGHYRPSWATLNVNGGPKLSASTAKMIGNMLVDLQNLQNLSFSNRIVISEEPAISYLTAGIRNSRSLQRLDLSFTELPDEDVETAIGRAIGQNSSLQYVDFPRVNSDQLSLLKNAMYNQQLILPRISSRENLDVFEIVTPLLRSGRSIERGLYVNIRSSEYGGAPPGMDEFLDGLANNQSLTELSIKGHVRMTRGQLQKMWAALQLQNHIVRLELDMAQMPEDWEEDFIGVLPTLSVKRIFLNPRRFNTTTVGWGQIFDAIKKNYDLEFFDVAFHRYDNLDANDSMMWKLAEHYCRWNYSGRRIELLEPYSFKPGLWPRVLANVNRLGGSVGGDRLSESCRLVAQIAGFTVDNSTRRMRRAQIIYDFLQGPLLEAFDS